MPIANRTSMEQLNKDLQALRVVVGEVYREIEKQIDEDKRAVIAGFSYTTSQNTARDAAIAVSQIQTAIDVAKATYQNPTP